MDFVLSCVNMHAIYNRYVLDGKLLTWYTDVKGDEVGFIHLGKIADIVGDEYSDQTTTFELVDRKKHVS